MQEYWKKNILCVVTLLSIWFLVSCVFGVMLADYLDQFRIPGTQVKVGFWFSQQGSIFVFVVLIAVYVRYMNRLDQKYREAQKQ